MAAIPILDDREFQEQVIGGAGAWVILFSSPWCGICKKVTPKVESLPPHYPGVSFGKVDVTRNPAVAAGFKVLGIPAVLLFKDGKERDRLVGDVSEDQIRKRIEGLR